MDCFISTLVLSRRQCWRHHRPLQKRANRRGLQPERAGFRAGRRSPLPALIFFCQGGVWLTDLFIHLYILRLLQHQEQVLTDTVDGREIYNTIRRKPKDAFYKNIVKKGYLLFNKGEICCACRCGVSDRPGSILNLVSSRHQAKASGGKTSTSSWREQTPSSSTLKAKREQPNPKGWSTWACAPSMACTTVCLAGELRVPFESDTRSPLELLYNRR